MTPQTAFSLSRRTFLKLLTAILTYLGIPHSFLGLLPARAQSPEPSAFVKGLPDVLCGPILRRVLDNSVSVWLAFKNPQTVTLYVYEVGTFTGDASSAQRPDAVLSGTAETVAIGDFLHVACVTALVDTPLLKSDTLYCYDVQMEGQGVTTNLRGVGLLTGALPLGYSENVLPRFALPPSSLHDLQLFHGSCRKPHAPGKDALAQLDAVLQGVFNATGDFTEQAIKRPHQLFLTGDQIYADDVSGRLLYHLSYLAGELLGWQEKLHAGGQIFSIRQYMERKETSILNAAFLPMLRSEYANAIGFTSTEAHSHLLSLGEYYAMYLCAWSDVVWPKDFPTIQQMLGHPDGLEGSSSPELAKIGRDRYALEESKYLELVNAFEVRFQEEAKDVAALTSFQQTLPHVRRALANVPTYMMCDDHEVTDDWFINREFMEGVARSEIAERVITNALTAFAIFQAWGNTPVRFMGQDAKGHALLESAENWNINRGSDQNTFQWMRELVGLYDWTTGRPARQSDIESNKRLIYDFILSWSTHRVVVLDTRTWRVFPSGRETVELIDGSVLDMQLGAINPSDNRPVFVVSPAPIFGMPLVERGVQEWGRALVTKVAQFAAARKTLFSGEDRKELHKIYAKLQRLNERFPFEADLEAWGSNNNAFQRLLLAMNQRWERVIILSGDVHYGFTIQVDFWNILTNRATSFAQLTASSFKNQADKTLKLHWLDYTGERTAQTLFPAAFNTYNWDAARQSVTTCTAQPTKTLVEKVKKYQLLRPVVNHFLRPLTTTLHHTNPTTLTALETRWWQASRNPDWVYQMRFVRDIVRPPTPYASSSLLNDWDVLSNSEKVARFAGTIDLAKTNMDDFLKDNGGYGIVGLNNLGHVKFSREIQGEMTHELLWNGMTTQHTLLLLSPKDIAPPEIVLGNCP